MTKALRKNTRRSISGSLGRYIAILLIIMLGVAFLTGLRDTRPIMSATETAYVKNTKLYDLRLISTIGFDADDVAAVQKADGVVAAAGSVNADFIWQHDNKERVYRAHMLTDNINEPVLTAGRMPENGSECLIDSSRFSEGMIGQTIEISDSQRRRYEEKLRIQHLHRGRPCRFSAVHPHAARHHVAWRRHAAGLRSHPGGRLRFRVLHRIIRYLHR